MALTVFPRFGSSRPKVPADAFRILEDLVPWQESVDATAAKVTQTGLRNRLINGALRLNQRAYVSGAAVTAGQYTFDRWAVNAPITFTSAPQGQLVTLSSPGSVWQLIERASMPAGRYVLSQKGNAPARVHNAGAAQPALVAAPFTVDLDGLTNVMVEFLGSSGQTVGEVQLEQISATGTVADATPFERRPLGMELALCQRYFIRFGGDSIQTAVTTGMTIATTIARFVLPLPVTMRAAPTGSTAGASSFQVRNAADLAYSLTALSFYFAGRQSVGIAATIGTANLTVGQAALLEAGAVATATIDLSAEL